MKTWHVLPLFSVALVIRLAPSVLAEIPPHPLACQGVVVPPPDHPLALPGVGCALSRQAVRVRSVGVSSSAPLCAFQRLDPFNHLGVFCNGASLG